MKIKQCMIYREVLAKRLERKRKQLVELERQINSEGVSSSVDKRKYIELKAIVRIALIWRILCLNLVRKKKKSSI